MDPLSILAGITLSAILEKILEESYDAAVEGIKDSASERLKEVLRRDPQKKLNRALVAAFLREVELELIGCGSSTDQIEQFKTPLVELFRSGFNGKVMVRAMSTDRQPPIAEAAGVAATWQSLSLPPLPEDFSWTRVVRRFDLAANTLRKSSEELRRLVEYAASTERPDLNLTAFGSTALETEAYADHLIKRFSRLRLEVLDPQPLQAALLLQNVYIEPDVYAVRYAELPSLEVAAVHEDESTAATSRVKISSVIAADSQGPLVLMGHPGSGKSSTLAAHCLTWAALPNSQRLLHALPVHIDLRHFATCARNSPMFDFLDYLTSAIGIPWRFRANELESLLAAGQACLLFDGLDEVIDLEQRRNISTEICRIAAIYEKATILLTSRIIGFSSVSAIFENHSFSLFAISTLSDAQIHSLVTRFHHAAFAGDPDEMRRGTDLLGTLHQVPAIRKLARSPLLLTLLCLLSRHHDLPRDKLTLLERSSALLLEQWDLTKSLPEDEDLKKVALGGQDKTLILENISSAMADDGRVSINERSLLRVIQETLERDRGHDNCRNIAAKVVKQLRERNYVLCLFGGDAYGFVHRFFADYFLSRYIVSRYSGLSEASRIDLDSLIGEYFIKFALNDFWQEPLQLVMRRLNSADGDAVILAILSEFEATQDINYLWFAAKCAGELSSPNKSKIVLRKLELKLRDIVEVPHQMFYNASPASSIDVQKFNYVQTQIRAVQAMARLPLLQSGGENWIRAVVSSSRNRLLRVSALNAYCTIVPSSQSLENWLLTIAKPESGDKVAYVRMAAMRQVAARFADEETADFLEALALDRSENKEVREVAVQELWRQWPERARGLDEASQETPRK